MAAMAVKHILKAYEPRIAVYGASLHRQVSQEIDTLSYPVLCLKMLIREALGGASGGFVWLGGGGGDVIG